MELRELQNDITVIGTLKSKDITEGVWENSGAEYVKGEIVVEVEQDGEIGEYKFDLYSNKKTFSGKDNGIAKGYLTVRDDFKTIAEHGKENADRVVVNGSLAFQEYVSNNTYNAFNTYDARFISRLKQPSEDKVMSEVEMVIHKIEPVKDPTTQAIIDYNFSGISVGYNNRVSYFTDLMMKPEFYEKCKSVYTIGSMVRVQLDLVNKVIVTQEQSGDALFGDIEPKVIKKYINEKRISGGMPPYTEKSVDAKGKPLLYSAEQIEHLFATREQEYQQKQSQIIPETNNNDVPFMNDSTPFGGETPMF